MKVTEHGNKMNIQLRHGRVSDRNTHIEGKEGTDGLCKQNEFDPQTVCDTPSAPKHVAH